MERPSSLQNFIKNSGVKVTRASPPSFPRRLQNSTINNQNLGNFAEFLNMSNSNNNNNVRYLTLSGLNLGMFNATVNKQFDAEARVDLKDILKKVPLGKTSIGQGLQLDTKEIVGVYGRFKTGFTHTREYGKRGDINLNFFTVQIKFSLTNGNETNGGTVNFYKNGKIRFSGGFIGKGDEIENQPELIRRFMVKNYTRGQSFFYNPFEYNNLSGQFRINGVIKDLGRLAANSRKYGFESNYEPELSPMMYSTYKGHKYIIAKSGAIQISGAKNPKALNDAYRTANQLFNMLYTKGEITLTAQVPNKIVRPTQKKSKASTCPKTRRPPCKAGFEAKKNPQGDECCYKIPKKKSTRKSPKNNKEITYKNGQLMIGKKKCEALTKPMLLEMAKKLGVVNAKDKNKKEKLCAMIKQFSFGNENFKVGNKPCISYKKSELVSMATSKGISVSNTDTIKTLCEKLKLNVNKRNANANAKAKENRALNAVLRKEAKIGNIEIRRKLNNAGIKNDILKLYGPRWMKKYGKVMNINKDVEEMSNLINNASKEKNVVNKMGVLKKMVANDLKKSLVSEWKKERALEYKKKLIKNEYGKHGNAVVNYVLTQNPTKTQIKQFIERYKKTRANLNKSK
jgi:hypothetical protein